MAIDNRKKKKIEEPIEIPEPVVDSDIPVEPVETPQEPIEEVAEVVTEPIEDIKEEVIEEVPVEKVKKDPEIDYKEKFSESSREAMALHFKNEKLTNLLTDELGVPDPTEDDLRIYAKLNDADYEDLDNFSKNILRKTLVAERKEAKRAAAYEEINKITAWANKVDDYVASEENIAKYPSLEGQEESFKKYCMKETQRGVDFNLLVASFLYENEKVAPEVKKKGSLLLSHGNGRAETPKPTGITAGEVESIRLRDPKEYRKLIKSGKIKIEI